MDIYNPAIIFYLRVEMLELKLFIIFLKKYIMIDMFNIIHIKFIFIIFIIFRML